MRLLLCLLLLLPALASADPASYAEREDVRAFVAEMHERNGFDNDELLHLFAQAQSLPVVIKEIQPPAEPGIRSWQLYRSRFVEPRRIRAGAKFWQANKASLARAEAQYGVPREIIVGILGVETIYGKHNGHFQTFSALATLAFDYPPRAALFRGELEALLLLAREEKRAVLDYRGSYAGAIGMPQFLPSSIRQWAVDFDGDGSIDLSSPADAIGSVARFLAEHGWEKGGLILTPAKADGSRIGELLAEGIKPQRTPEQLAAFGVTANDAPPCPAALIDYVTPEVPTSYRLGYNNFYVITRYNRSTFYATAVYELAETVKAHLTPRP
ncbi:Membrane-bound lytic murein transglycosylase B [Georgfuchsia toluolica]|uniref:Membrane-bound lytic murein transglycosylase B n=1 Tax=Georgfuchsia toluolica TaxID=424218 RepID=A0A916J2W0_9PROT|nr:lytic murein transglycosylase B [Georgfuchsia toluolica]CAG4882960.1 Membrane-bound lytic murein transglycosylase B [Georgfuchsia toluolica]